MRYFFGLALIFFLSSTFVGYLEGRDRITNPEHADHWIVNFVEVAESGNLIYVCDGISHARWNPNTNQLINVAPSVGDSDYTIPLPAWDFVDTDIVISAFLGGAGAWSIQRAALDIFRSGWLRRIRNISGAVLGIVSGYYAGYYLAATATINCTSDTLLNRVASSERWKQIEVIKYQELLTQIQYLNETFGLERTGGTL